MSRKHKGPLEIVHKSGQVDKITAVQGEPFKIAFEHELQNGYELKDLKQADIQALHKFIAETVYQGLTISKVDQLFLRKEGLSNAPKDKFRGQQLVHYGKDRSPFRIFGYYNNGYFVVCKIDPHHQTHQ